MSRINQGHDDTLECLLTSEYKHNTLKSAFVSHFVRLLWRDSLRVFLFISFIYMKIHCTG